ncbi:MAG: hypothetical protein UIJ88_07530 [Anaerovoracaceae bacterium]|nr:hypothetical protein [Anaerovoracaceae bacterium]
MKIEVLFPEICNLYGDLANVRYLAACLPEARIVRTGLKDEPLFLTEKPDLIYMGTATERGQELAIKALSPYRDRIRELIDEGSAFLITGNALEIFGNSIAEEGVKVCDGLGILPVEARRKARKRFNSLYVGDFTDKTMAEPVKIVGFKSLFGFSYGDISQKYLFMTQRGTGMNPDIKEEGIRINNFFATYITGPLLILNPPFTRWFIKNILKEDIEHLACEQAATEAYEARLEEYLDPSTGVSY